ncbi:conserved hypothetical protein [Agrobacterium deltaense Zutra 3/1]|uniref:Uncharacterized protein n=1 Tax=Agrobacterium deltaense Zutra 3/1 TaxID=1183427 RepID=A0A1S7RS65_9HYPH|nr:hypothetical protein [Agrobacterium deltaense]CUX56754.1 conserved hypothetical protein [Agrobacterium deltaense Zutra 3/1]
MLRERLGLLANRILNDDAFGDAVAYLCTHISIAFKQEQRLVRALGDFGAFATVMCAAGIASVNGGQFTLAAVQAVVVPPGWASSRRTRALIDWLELENTAQRHPPGGDNRERPWSLNGWIISAIETLASTYRLAASPWETLPAPAEGAIGTDALIDGVSWFLRHAQDLPFLSEEMRMFLGHAPGFPILLDLLSAAKTDACDATGCVFSRKATARAYGISRAHVTAILARAERLNILQRNGPRIVLSDPALQNVRRDLAYQLAFVVLWAEAVRTSPPSADAPESLSGWNGSSNPR